MPTKSSSKPIPYFIASLIDGFSGMDHTYYDLPWSNVKTHTSKEMPWETSITTRFYQVQKTCPRNFWTLGTILRWQKYSEPEHSHIRSKELVLEHIQDCESCKMWMKGVPLEKVMKKHIKRLSRSSI